MRIDQFPTCDGEHVQAIRGDLHMATRETKCCGGPEILEKPISNFSLLEQFILRAPFGSKLFQI